VCEGVNEALTLAGCEAGKYLVHALAPLALDVANGVSGCVRQVVADEAAVVRVFLAGYELIAHQAVHDAGEGGRSDTEGLGEGTCREALALSKDKEDTDLSDSQAEAGPRLEATRVGADDDAAEEVEGLVK
jgi:hypothetical protein